VIAPRYAVRLIGEAPAADVSTYGDRIFSEEKQTSLGDGGFSEEKQTRKRG
jgi:hypothetical protein